MYKLPKLGGSWATTDPWFLVGHPCSVSPWRAVPGRRHLPLVPVGSAAQLSPRAVTQKPEGSS